MKRWIPWVAAAIVVVLVGGGAWRTMAARQAQHKAQAEATAQKAQAPLQLTADEVIAVRRQSLTLGGGFRAGLGAGRRARLRLGQSRRRRHECSQSRPDQKLLVHDCPPSSERRRQA